MTPAQIRLEIARCDREIAAALAQTDAPAYLVMLGVEDWIYERRTLERMLHDHPAPHRLPPAA